MRRVFFNERGFSLIELVVVVAVLAILVVAALPAYKDYILKSKISSVMPRLQYVSTLAAEYMNKNGVFPSNMNLLIPDVSIYNNDVIIYTSLFDGACNGAGSAGPCVFFGLNPTLFGSASEKTLVLTLTDQSGVLKWACRTEVASNPKSLPTKYLPSGCKVCTGVETGCVAQ